jgi:hypothetical protein
VFVPRSCPVLLRRPGPDFGDGVGVVGCVEAGVFGGCWLTGERFRLRFGTR